MKKLIDAGADINYKRYQTNMTAMHWLAYNNDIKAIKVLLDSGADHLILSHANNLPIDVAGTTPSYAVVDCLLDHFCLENCLPS